ASKQWFVRMRPLAEPAIRAVKEGRIKFVPERFAKHYLNWMENIRDWCISRQLWWGHQIPVWYCAACEAEITAAGAPAACPKCGGRELTQDPDVLDTWFSSALWPFSTLGWPERTPELAYFYPTSVLVTAWDIIPFWVARMIFMGLECMGEEPFSHAMIHGLILDKNGKKMSKSRPETSIDPKEVIEKYGADTLRFSVLVGNAPGQDLKFYWEKVESARNFGNKIWNAARFVLMNLADFDGGALPRGGSLTLADRWIISRLQRVTSEATGALARFDPGAAATLLNDFIWSEYCDWYIETAKPRLAAGGDARRTAQSVLVHVMRQAMELLHPFMPFITEEIWQSLPHEGATVMKAPWPRADAALIDAAAEEEFARLVEIVRAIRNIRAEASVAPGKRIAAVVLAHDGAAAALEAGREYLMALAGLGSLEIASDEGKKPAKAMSAVAGGAQIYLPLADLVDLALETARLEKELAATADEVERQRAKLANEGFTAKAPAAVVEKERAKLAMAEEKRRKLEARLFELRS
ncbi:MAG: class I tRNA ligase family protein, partial [Patescibacteria group bacterium]